jgi:hypothetical protein
VPLSTKPFFTDNPGSIPYEYIVPATVELRVQSIVARFDGTAASGEFYPCLAIYTQDNHLLARIRTDQKFSVGDTGVVTWGPFLRQAAAATPAPPSSGAIEWVYYESTTDWGGGGLTTLTFTAVGGNYNAGVTFDLAAGNPQICRSGHYQAQLGIFNYVALPGVQTIIRADLLRAAGPVPGSWRSFASSIPQLSGGEWSTVNVVAWPYSVDFVDFPSTTSFATKFSFQVKAWRLDNGAITADIDPVVRLAIQRLGDSYS